MKAIQIVHHKSKRIYGIMKYKKDEICYIIENNIKIVPVKILKYSSEFYTVKLLSKAGAIRLKEHRIFATEEEARKILGIDRVNINFKNLNYADGCIMINFGPLPNNGNKEIEMPLPAGVTDYWIESGWAYGSDKRRYPLPYVDVSTWGYSISCMISSPGRLQISTKSDWTGYSAKFLVAYKL